MGAPRADAPTATPGHRPTRQRPSHRAQWHPLDPAPWRDLPERYGSHNTVWSRFRRWRDAGLLDQLLHRLQEDAAHDDELDGSLTMIDGSNVRAHQQAAGARKKGAPIPNSAAVAGDMAAHST